MSLAFETAPFFSDAFDVDVWIAEQVGPVPREIVLEQLRNDLGRYQSQLKAELVSTVNRDYAGFVQLSSKMETFHDAVLRFQPPLSHVHDRLRAVSIAVDDKLRRLKSLVRDRDAVRDAKALLHDFIRADELINKVENVLQAHSGAESEEGADDVDTTTSRYLRVGNWLQELQSLATKHAALPFFVLILPRIKVAKASLDDQLKTTFISLIRGLSSSGSRHTTALEHSLRAFVVAGSGDFAEKVIITEIVEPYLSEMFTPARMDGDSGRGSCVGLPPLLLATLEFIEGRFGPLISACEGCGNVAAIDVAGNCLWKPCLDAMTHASPDMLACLEANTFHTAYTSVSQFFLKFHTFVGNVSWSAAQRLTCHPSVTSLTARLRNRILPLYYGLRFQEITFGLVNDTKAEATPVATPIPLQTPSDAQPAFFQLQASSSLWTALVRCWDPAVFLPALVQSFATGTAQMLNFYIDWAKKAIPPEGARMSPETGVAITSDANTLATHIQATLFPLICNATFHTCDDTLEAVLLPCVAQLQSIAETAWSSVVSVITTQCVTALSEVKSISGTYVLTGKPAPTRASPFVAKFLKGLQEFLSQQRPVFTSGGVSPASVRQLVVDVLSNTARQYDTAIVDLQAAVSSRLAGVAALGWMKGGSGTTPGTTVTLSDSDKVNLQLQFDVKAFTEMAQDIGSRCDPPVAVSELAAAVALQDRVKFAPS